MKNYIVLPEQLRSFDYYVKKMPLYLQNSHGFIEHYRIWYDILVGQHHASINQCGVIGSSSVLFNLLNIFNQTKLYDGTIQNTYLRDLVTIDDADVDENNRYGKKSDMLDKLGALFNISRKFEVQFDRNSQLQIVDLNLNNEEFLLLIKAQIISNYYDGSREQAEEYYDDVGLQVIMTTSRSEPATADIYLPISKTQVVSQNVQDMFLAGLLTIESAGIKYRRTVIEIDKVLVWDSYSQSKDNGWDGGNWVV